MPKETKIPAAPKQYPKWVPYFFGHAAQCNGVHVKEYKKVIKDFDKHWDSFKENIDEAKANEPKKEKKPTNKAKPIETAFKKYSEAIEASDDQEEVLAMQQSLQETISKIPDGVKQQIVATLGAEANNNNNSSPPEATEFVEKAKGTLKEVNESMDQFNNEIEKRQIESSDPLCISVQRMYNSVVELIEE